MLLLIFSVVLVLIFDTKVCDLILDYINKILRFIVWSFIFYTYFVFEFLKVLFFYILKSYVIPEYITIVNTLRNHNQTLFLFYIFYN